MLNIAPEWDVASLPPIMTTGLIVVIRGHKGRSCIIAGSLRTDDGLIFTVEQLPELLKQLQDTERKCREMGMLP